MKDTFKPEALEQLREGYGVAQREAHEVFRDLMFFGAKLTSPRAKEYLHNGICRRLRLLQRCVERIFEICPLDRSERFDQDELQDVDINLHAFLVNVWGTLDNVAWVVFFEATGREPAQRKDILLYGPEVQKHLSPHAIDFLKTMKPWHDKYVKGFRDSLAHRIPAYVPPMRMTEAEAKRSQELEQEILERIEAHDFDAVEKLEEEQEKLGSLEPRFTHSWGDPDRSGPALLHGQVIIDLRTISAILRAVVLDGNAVGPHRTTPEPSR